MKKLDEEVDFDEEQLKISKLKMNVCEERQIYVFAITRRRKFT